MVDLRKKIPCSLISRAKGHAKKFMGKTISCTEKNITHTNNAEKKSYSSGDIHFWIYDDVTDNFVLDLQRKINIRNVFAPLLFWFLSFMPWDHALFSRSEFIVSSRAKRACVTWTAGCLSQMQNSIRHKSLYEYMLGDLSLFISLWIYSCVENFAFPGNIDFAADDQRIVMYYSWKAHV